MVHLEVNVSFAVSALGACVALPWAHVKVKIVLSWENVLVSISTEPHETLLQGIVGSISEVEIVELVLWLHHDIDVSIELSRNSLNNKPSIGLSLLDKSLSATWQERGACRDLPLAVPVLGQIIWYNTLKVPSGFNWDITFFDGQDISISGTVVGVRRGQEIHQEPVVDAVRLPDAESIVVALAPDIALAIWINLGHTPSQSVITERITANTFGKIRNEMISQKVSGVGSEDVGV